MFQNTVLGRQFLFFPEAARRENHRNRKLRVWFRDYGPLRLADIYLSEVLQKAK